MTPRSKTTLLDLVQAVSDYADSEAELIATVAYLVNSGKVRLCGNFAGAKIDLTIPAQGDPFWPQPPPSSLRNSAHMAAQ